MAWGLRDALDILRRNFPQAFVTSGKRDPNSELGRANPRSYHNHGRAFDIRPMKGVDFNDYVERLRQGGMNIVEALDEQKNPKPWTTGPNWHIAFDAPARRKEYYPERKDKQMPSPLANTLGQMPQFSISNTPGLPGFDIREALGSIQLPDHMGGINKALADNSAKKKEGGPLGKDSILWKILGVAGDAYLGAWGKGTPYRDGLIKSRAIEAEREMFREKMEAEANAQRARDEAEQNKPYRFTNSAGDVVSIAPGEDPRVLYADPFGRPNFQRVENPETGGIELVNNGASSRPSEGHIRHLLQTGDKRNFDAKFGPGMADYYLQQFGSGF